MLRPIDAKREIAATRVQAAWRAHSTRRALAAQAAAALVVQKCYRRWRSRRRLLASHDSLRTHQHAVDADVLRQQRIARKQELAAAVEMTPAAELPSVSDATDQAAAVAVQRVWRGFHARQNAQLLRENNAQVAAARKIQAFYRRHLFSRQLLLARRPVTLSDELRAKWQPVIQARLRAASPPKDPATREHLRTTAAMLMARRDSKVALALDLRLEAQLAALRDATGIGQSKDVQKRARQRHERDLAAAMPPPSWWEKLLLAS